MINNKIIIPEKMQAIEISEFGGPEKLKECIRKIPVLENNQVLIKDRVIIKFQQRRQIFQA